MLHLRSHVKHMKCLPSCKKYFPLGVRESLFVSAYSDDKFCGMAEYAPLEGINSDSLEVAMRQVCGNTDIELPLEEKNFAKLAYEFSKYKSPLSYVLSMIHFHHLVLNDSVDTSKKDIKVSALIIDNEEQKEIDPNISCLKVKIGRISVEDEIKRLNAINDMTNGSCVLRLDANKSLSERYLKQLLPNIVHMPIEYIEEPCTNIEEAGWIKKHYGISLAMDESFVEPFDLNYLSDNDVDYLIIKPSRFTSLYHVALMVEESLKHGIKPIFSHCFESSFTSFIMSRLILELKIDHLAHGIMSGIFFED